MERGDHPHSIDVEKLAAKFRNRDVALEHILCGKCAETAHHFWTNDGQLPFEKRIAGEDFVGLRDDVDGGAEL